MIIDGASEVRILNMIWAEEKANNYSSVLVNAYPDESVAWMAMIVIESDPKEVFAEVFVETTTPWSWK